MNFLNYVLRYWFVMGQAVYKENYRDQVMFNEVWMRVIEKISNKTKND